MATKHRQILPYRNAGQEINTKGKVEVYKLHFPELNNGIAVVKIVVQGCGHVNKAYEECPKTDDLEHPAVINKL